VMILLKRTRKAMKKGTDPSCGIAFCAAVVCWAGGASALCFIPEGCIPTMGGATSAGMLHDNREEP